MKGTRLVDTNVIVRYLVQDHEKHSRAATKLIEACDRGEFTLVLLPVVVAECVFVLESFYGHARSEIARVLSNLLTSPGVEVAELTVYLDALNRYREHKLHFVDCVIGAKAAATGVPVATFDGDFRKFSDVAVEMD